MNSPSETALIVWLEGAEREVCRIGAAKAARLSRRFDGLPEKVWAACTGPELLRQWFAVVNGEFREGGTLTFEVGAPCVINSRILRCDPLARLLLTWSYPGRAVDEVELRLRPDHGGTLVRLEHRSVDQTDWWFGAGSGWEAALIRLSVLLEGEDPAAISAEVLDQKLGPLWKDAGQACV